MGARAQVKGEAVAGAVHGLEGKLFLFDLKAKHVFLQQCR